MDAFHLWQLSEWLGKVRVGRKTQRHQQTQRDYF